MSEIKEKRQVSKGIVLGSFLLFIFMIFTYGYMHQSHTAAASNEQSKVKSVYIRVKPGMDAEKIANLLRDRKVIDNVYMFRIMAKVEGLDNNLKTGDYQLQTNMTYKEILEVLASGKTATMSIMIPEGYNVEQIAKTLQDKGIVNAKDFEKAATDFAPYDYITKANDVKYRVDGFLFPDTYEIAGDFTATDILTLMAKEFDHKLTPEMRSRADAMNLSIRELVILASLVEKEAQVEEDRPIIAQVFMNRLREKMPLQSCATIQYILGNPKAELSIQDTQIKSPYNTYLNMGLPPGPIANPGIASIKAVLYSEPTDYLYFVADKYGKHHFSKTYQEHLQTIDRVE